MKGKKKKRNKKERKTRAVEGGRVRTTRVHAELHAMARRGGGGSALWAGGGARVVDGLSSFFFSFVFFLKVEKQRQQAASGMGRPLPCSSGGCPGWVAGVCGQRTTDHGAKGDVARVHARSNQLQPGRKEVRAGQARGWRGRVSRGCRAGVVPPVAALAPLAFFLGFEWPIFANIGKKKRRMRAQHELRSIALHFSPAGQQPMAWKKRGGSTGSRHMGFAARLSGK